jgi:hypothetical protein
LVLIFYQVFDDMFNKIGVSPVMNNSEAMIWAWETEHNNNDVMVKVKGEIMCLHCPGNLL